MVNGEMVYADGRFLPKIKPYHYAATMKKTIRIGKLREEDFRVKAHASRNRVRIIEIVNPTITKESVATLRTVSGYLEKDLAADIVPAAVINRNDKKKMGRGFIRGTGIKQGAMATTVSWDTGNPLVSREQ